MAAQNNNGTNQGNEDGTAPPITDSMGIYGISGKGPVKATRQIGLRQEDSQGSLKQGASASASAPQTNSQP